MLTVISYNYLPGSRLFFRSILFSYLRSHSDRRLICPSMGRRNNEQKPNNTLKQEEEKKNNSGRATFDFDAAVGLNFLRWKKKRERNELVAHRRELICSRARAPIKCVLTSKLASALARSLSQSRRSRQHRHRQRFPSIARLVVLNRERNTQNANQS